MASFPNYDIIVPSCKRNTALSRLLIHIGYHKTASTWLQQELFTARSDVFVPLAPDGNPRYLAWKFLFDEQGYANSPFASVTDRIRTEYAALMESLNVGDKCPVISAEFLSGRLHGGGFDSKLIADRLKDCFPEAKIFCVIREQKSIIFSTYSQYIQVGGTRRLKHFLAPKTDRELPGFSPEHFRYLPLISYYHDLFGPENVLALPFEMFQADPAAFVANLGEFAGVSLQPENLKFETVYNKGGTLLMQFMLPFMNLFSMDTTVNGFSPFHTPGAYTFVKVANWLLNRTAPWLKTTIRRRLKKQVAAFVGERYEESNRKLSSLIGLDLSRYGYHKP